jgi:hypothetical protein
MRLALALFVGVALLAGSVQAADLTADLKQGTPDLKSAGPLAFAPDGVLLIGDPLGAAIFAIDTADRTRQTSGNGLTVEGINEKIASLLGTSPKEIQIADLKVNPVSGNVYLSVSRGRGPGATPVIVKVDRTGRVTEFSLKNVKFAKATLPNAPAPDAKDRRGQMQRQESITDLAYVDGRVFVAGLSNEEFASKLRAIPYPFTGVDKGTSVEIFHGAHGRFETNAPVRTFVPYQIQGEQHLLAAYTCTPLVKFPISQLKPGSHLKGTTVAELGNRNRPLDMIIYQKAGKDYILLNNSSRGVMKITTENIDKIEGISKPVKTEKAGLTYETISALKGVEQLDKLDQQQALLLVRSGSGALNLQTLPLP